MLREKFGVYRDGDLCRSCRRVWLLTTRIRHEFVRAGRETVRGLWLEGGRLTNGEYTWMDGRVARGEYWRLRKVRARVGVPVGSQGLNLLCGFISSIR